MLYMYPPDDWLKTGCGAGSEQTKAIDPQSVCCTLFCEGLNLARSHFIRRLLMIFKVNVVLNRTRDLKSNNDGDGYGNVP